MAQNEYLISYDQTDDIKFPSRRGMERYLQQEAKLWAPFLNDMPAQLPASITFGANGYQVSTQQLAQAFGSIMTHLDDPNQFNRASNRFSGPNIRLPPPSSSLAGELILGLFEVGLREQAVAAYAYFVAVETKTPIENSKFLVKGKQLVEAAPIAKALPYHRTSTAKLAGAVRMAQNHVDSLSNEVSSAIAINERHEEELQTQLEDQRRLARHTNEVIRRLNRMQASRHKRWVEATDEVVAEKFDEAQKKVRLFELSSKRAEDQRVQEFQRLQSLFETQLRLRAPVKLWETRQAKHTKNSNKSMMRFLVVGVVTILFGLLVPFLAGDYIANSFYQQLCSVPATDAALAQDCERVFSAKGPVTITGLLLVMSLLMWMARLQYRVHLSERHLALDASEKMAFAETYLAMKEGKDVGRDNEAIVLASLFRPTQDGIIRDDDSAMDLSAVTVLAKQLGRNN